SESTHKFAPCSSQTRGASGASASAERVTAGSGSYRTSTFCGQGNSWGPRFGDEWLRDGGRGSAAPPRRSPIIGWGFAGLEQQSVHTCRFLLEMLSFRIAKL